MAIDFDVLDAERHSRVEVKHDGRTLGLQLYGVQVQCPGCEGYAGLDVEQTRFQDRPGSIWRIICRACKEVGEHRDNPRDAARVFEVREPELKPTKTRIATVPAVAPCPFCDGQAEYMKSASARDAAPQWFVCCNGCHATGPYGSSPRRAVLRWNKPLRKRLAELVLDDE